MNSELSKKQEKLKSLKRAVDNHEKTRSRVPFPSAHSLARGGLVNTTHLANLERDRRFIKDTMRNKHRNVAKRLMTAAIHTRDDVLTNAIAQADASISDRLKPLENLLAECKAQSATLSQTIKETSDQYLDPSPASPRQNSSLSQSGFAQDLRENFEKELEGLVDESTSIEDQANMFAQFEAAERNRLSNHVEPSLNHLHSTISHLQTEAADVSAQWEELERNTAYMDELTDMGTDLEGIRSWVKGWPHVKGEFEERIDRKEEMEMTVERTEKLYHGVLGGSWRAILDGYGAGVEGADGTAGGAEGGGMSLLDFLTDSTEKAGSTAAHKVLNELRTEAQQTGKTVLFEAGQRWLKANPEWAKEVQSLFDGYDEVVAMLDQVDRPLVGEQDGRADERGVCIGSETALEPPEAASLVDELAPAHKKARIHPPSE
ncbi:hypothetical protein HDV00_004195 [Rhizophlyctis rosea]|nr:hypothetical protein HDV00_004195 [Rhizophlyctis rosea]